MQNDADKIIDNDWLHNTPTLSIKTSHVVPNGAHRFSVSKITVDFRIIVVHITFKLLETKTSMVHIAIWSEGLSGSLMFLLHEGFRV